MAVASPLLQVSKSFISREACKTSRVGARIVGQLGGKVAIGAVVNLGKCILRHVLNAALNVKCLLNPEKTARFIAVPAIQR